MTTQDLSLHLLNELTPRMGSGEARSVARLFLEDLFGYRPGNRPRELTQDEQILAWASINRLKAGEPIQYVTGIADFYGLRLRVSPAVLIPRPETEELVEWILEENAPGTQVQCLDVGTGSGCIILALAAKRPGWGCFGTDISQDALDIATANREELDLRVVFTQSDARGPLPYPGEGLDIIVSNPPYIPPSERSRMGPSVLTHEPELALFVPEDDPLLFYRHIAEQGKALLVRGGRLYLETNEFNHKDVVLLLEELGYGAVAGRQDLQGKQRMVRAVRN